MIFILVPLAVVVIIALLCVDVKIGFLVADATMGSGFSVGYYMMTVLGLIAAEASAITWLALRFA